MTTNSSDLLVSLADVVQSKEQELIHDNNYKLLLETDEQYKELLKKGIIKKRGFQLQSIEDTLLLNCSFKVSNL